jgi:hypothetical protein
MQHHIYRRHPILNVRFALKELKKKTQVNYSVATSIVKSVFMASLHLISLKPAKPTS